MTGAARALRKRGRRFGRVAAALGVAREGCIAGLEREGVLYRPAPRPGRPFTETREPAALGAAGEILGEGRCRWVEGDPGAGSWRMCGERAVQASAWCAHHFGRVYRRGEGG